MTQKSSNVFIKAAGKKWLWNYVEKELKNYGAWNNVFYEPPNSSSRVNKFIPKQVRNYNCYRGKGREVRLLMETDLSRFLEYISRQAGHTQTDNYFHPLHEDINMFNILIEHFANFYSQNNIDLVIFGRPPHLGQDYVAYRVAETMGIKTLIMHSLPYVVKGRFFHVLNNNDFGTFDTSIRTNDNLSFVDIEKGYDRDINFIKQVVSRNKSMFGNIRDNPTFSTLYDIYKSKEFIKPILRFKLKKSFKHNFLNTVQNTLPEALKFVYFPLQLQPEMTTSNWGGIYRDQTLAIEHLASILPSGWNIVVKENPKQKYFQRGNLFFARLSALKNVSLVSKDLNSIQLIRKSQLVATVTGTAGWEAICGGKPVILFGNPWYKSMPGAYKFNFDLNLEELTAVEIDHDSLVKSFNELLKLTHEGVTAYKHRHEDLDYIVNAKNVARGINTILQY